MLTVCNLKFLASISSDDLGHEREREKIMPNKGSQLASERGFKVAYVTRSAYIVPRNHSNMGCLVKS